VNRQAALGFDIGTTSVKAGLLWLDGDAPMTVVSRPYPTARPRPGWVEQDPADWIEAMAACWAELSRSAPDVQLSSVGVCSQVNTHLFVGADRRPLRPAITWQDTRAAAEAAELDALADPRRAELWGGPFSIDPSFSLARLLWLARHEPDVRAAARWMLLPKDFCIAALTGLVTTDPMSPVGLVGAGDRYMDEVLDLVDGAQTLTAPLRAFDDVADLTLAGNPVGLPAGVPVAVSTMDAWASIFGSGLMTPGRALDVAGTSEIVAVSSELAVPTEGIVSFPPVHGVHIHAGPTQAGGSALEWIAGLCSLSLPEALEASAIAARRPQPVVFLPHLAGERAPYWNADARGVFLGMTTSTGAGDLVLATLEGVAFSVRMLMDRCQAAAGHSVDAVRACGGGARSPQWTQIKASVLGCPIDVLETPDAGVLGSALVGIVAAGIEDDLVDLAERCVHVSSRVDPDAAAEPRLVDLFGVYEDAYRALEPLFPRLTSASSVA
jgi:xylulokinase